MSSWRTIIYGLTISVLMMLFISQSGCRKPPNNFNANSTNFNPNINSTINSSDEPKQSLRTDFNDEDERVIVGNFERALLELEAITTSCDQEDWELAGQHYEAFQQATRVRPQPKLDHPDISLALLDAFDLYNVQLEQAINGKDWVEATFNTNQLTNILNDLMAQLQADNSGMEARRELRRLIFLNREMELWANRGNEAMVKVRAIRLRKAWNDLRPVIYDHRGSQAAEQFDAIATRLEKLESIEDYQNLATDLSNAVTSVATVFTEQH